MNAKRPPSAPPDLRGFDYVQHLGSGGFADVFLYQQKMPRRRVAVKVLLPDKVAAAAAADFTAEANVMAQVSGHPSIVSIYEADVSRDGRPYIVMEYCPKPNLQARYRKGPFSLAEALRIGVQIAGAVETAHRAGIIHRDIKPANILVTEYNRPALTDFGIAGTAAGESAGMSIPWSPPESFIEGVASSVATDVWALGATVYTLLTGRSPFELPGHKNNAADLMSRIQTSPLPPIERADSPSSLQLVLAKSMAKAPGDRYASALDLGRALQKVQIELAMSVTPIDVVDDSIEAEEAEEDEDGRTRVRAVRSIDPEGPEGPGGIPLATGSTGPLTTASTGPMAAPPAPADVEDATVVRGRTSSAPVDDRTVVRGAAVAPDEGETNVRPPQLPPSEPAERRSPAGWIVGGAVGLVVAGAAVAVATMGGGAPGPSPSPTQSVRPVDDVVIESQVPQVTEISVETTDGRHVFSWVNPSPREGDSYLWGVRIGDEVVEFLQTPDTTVSLDADEHEAPCIEVLLRRADGRASSQPGVGCVGDA